MKDYYTKKSILSGAAALRKGQQDSTDYEVNSILQSGNADLVEGQSKKQAANVAKAGRAQTSQVSSLLSQAGVAGTSPTAQLLQDTVNENVQSDIMQTLLQGKLSALNLRYQAKQSKNAASNSLLGSFLTAGTQLYSGYQLDKQNNQPVK